MSAVDGVNAVDLELIRATLSGRAPRELEPEGGRRAAVATVIRGDEAGEPEVLLIRRAEHPADPWSGHMAFPGGRHDSTDPDLLSTAVRETLEEVGLSLCRDARLIGRLDDVPAVARARRTGMVITPFVFEVAGEPSLVLNHEVAEVLWAPMGPLIRGEADTVRPYQHEGRRYDLPAYDVEGRIVWGLTYQMLQALFGVLRSGGG